MMMVVLRPVVSTRWPRINARDPEVVLFLNAVHCSPVRILIKGIKRAAMGLKFRRIRGESWRALCMAHPVPDANCVYDRSSPATLTLVRGPRYSPWLDAEPTPIYSASPRIPLVLTRLYELVREPRAFHSRGKTTRFSPFRITHLICQIRVSNEADWYRGSIRRGIEAGLFVKFDRVIRGIFRMRRVDIIITANSMFRVCFGYVD